MSLVNRAVALADRLSELALARSTLDMSRLLTLLVLLLHGPKDWYVRHPIYLLGIAGILSKRARAEPLFWIIVSMFVLAHDIVGWASVDNHKWLMAYWCIAQAFVAMAPAREQLGVMKLNARLLLGLCFTFATIWKLISFDYLDSTFFHYELLADKRFRDAAHYVGGADQKGLRDNNRMKSKLRKSYREAEEPFDVVKLQSGPRVRLMAVGMTWWTILIEGAIGVFFLLPYGSRLFAILRSLIVLAFAATTYLLAPVLGFGWLVVIMGFVQCPEEFKKVRASFLVVLGLMYLYRLKLGPMILKTAEDGFAEMVRFF